MSGRSLDLVGIGSMVVDRVHRAPRLLGAEQKAILRDVEDAGPVRRHVGGVVLNHLGWAAALGLRVGIFGRQAADAGDMVWQVMAARHQQTGQLMSEKDAASEVEAYLEKLVTKALENEKTRGKFQQAAPAPTTPNPGPPTLSNQQTSGNTARPATLSPSMDRDASLQEAAKLIEWSD